MSIGVRAFIIQNSDSKDEDYSLKASDKKDLRHPAKPLYRNELDTDAAIVSNEHSEEEFYRMVLEVNRRLLKQNSQNPQSLNNTIQSHADQNTSTVTRKALDSVNQIALAIDKLANKNPQQSLFHPTNTLLFNRKIEKNENFEKFEDLFHTTIHTPEPN